MVLVTCNRALAQGDFCLLALIFCHQTCRTPEKHKASQSSAKLCVPPTTTCITSKKIAVMSNDAADFFSFTTSPHPACIPFRHNCSECLLWARSGS